MSKEAWKADLVTQQRFFHNAIRGLTEADAGFAPAAEMFTVAQQIAHVAQTVEWFVDGAFSPEGMTQDFGEHLKEIRATTSLAAALSWFDRAYERAIKAVDDHSEEEWNQPIAGDIIGGHPRHYALIAMGDHTAHHRGALTVYIRMRGMVPQMPYM